MLGLSQREWWWKDAEILMLRHQLAVAERQRLAFILFIPHDRTRSLRYARCPMASPTWISSGSSGMTVPEV